MKRGRSPKGFTIVETMIFLAVSSAILVSALTLVSGSQGKTQFSQAMNDVNQQLNTIVSNVANGYYPRNGDIDCIVRSTDLDIHPGTHDRGTDPDCVFIGRVAQFSYDQDHVLVYDVAGARLTDGVNPQEVVKMTDSKATALSNPESIELKNGITIQSIEVLGRGNVGAIGFFTGFGQNGSDGQLQSGSLLTDFVGFPGSSIDADNVSVEVKDNSVSGFRKTYDNYKNPTDGIRLCFKGGTTNQIGVITLGGNSKGATSTLTIGTSCS